MRSPAARRLGLRRRRRERALGDAPSTSLSFLLFLDRKRPISEAQDLRRKLFLFFFGLGQTGSNIIGDREARTTPPTTDLPQVALTEVALRGKLLICQPSGLLRKDKRMDILGNFWHTIELASCKLLFKSFRHANFAPC